VDALYAHVKDLSRRLDELEAHAVPDAVKARPAAARPKPAPRPRPKRGRRA